MNQGIPLNLDETRRELRGFRDYYTREIEPWMTAQQERQRRARWWAAKVGAVGLVVTAGSVWLLLWFVGPFEEWEDWIALPIGLFVVSGVVALARLVGLQGKVRGFLLDKVCTFFGFEYAQRARGVRFDDFAQSGLLPHHDRRELEDHFRGKHDGVEFDFLECTLEVRKKARGRDSDYWKEVYHGVVFRLAFPKQFNGRTLVLKDAGLIGNLVKNFKESGERIRLEDPRFEKMFAVWGSDQIEARYLLTPTFMERLVQLANALDSKRFEVSFFNNLLLVSVHVNADQFEGGGMFTDVTDKRRVEQLVNEICRVFDIVDTLQLALSTKI